MNSIALLGEKKLQNTEHIFLFNRTLILRTNNQLEDIIINTAYRTQQTCIRFFFAWASGFLNWFVNWLRHWDYFSNSWLQNIFLNYCSSVLTLASFKLLRPQNIQLCFRTSKTTELLMATKSRQTISSLNLLIRKLFQNKSFTIKTMLQVKSSNHKISLTTTRGIVLIIAYYTVIAEIL